MLYREHNILLSNINTKKKCWRHWLVCTRIVSKWREKLLSFRCICKFASWNYQLCHHLRVCLHRTTWIALDGFSLKVLFENLTWNSTSTKNLTSITGALHEALSTLMITANSALLWMTNLPNRSSRQYQYTHLSSINTILYMRKHGKISWSLYQAFSINRWKKPTNAQGCCKKFIVLIKSPTCFDIQMPSSGGYLFLF
jgi:hypothetical protein